MPRSSTTVRLSRRRAAPLPRGIEPMLALSSAELPSNQDQFSFEFKWDGVRGVTYWDGKDLKIVSRNQLDMTARYPELAGLAEALGRGQRVILDGEIVALDENDRPSFPLLQRRMHLHPRSAERMSAEVPVYYMIFDLLYAGGGSIMDRPWTRRREMLEDLALLGPHWRISPARIGGGNAMWKTAKLHLLEGVVAKRTDSLYLPGRRTPAWQKIKIILGQEFVVGGWSPEQGTTNSIGALHVGYYDPGNPRKLRYAGAVGSGFKAADLARLGAQMRQLASAQNPFSDSLGRKDVRFVNPQVVVDVEYRRWPATGHLQQAAYKGVRTDKRANQVVREDPSVVS